MAHGRQVGGCADERSFLGGWSSVRRGNDCPRARQTPRDRLVSPPLAGLIRSLWNGSRTVGGVTVAKGTFRSALLITGTVGAGKTSVAEMVGDLLSEAGVPNAVIDLDWLRRCWPSPAGDRFNLAMSLRNLRPMARNYLDAGAVRIVLSGVIETQIERERHLDALGVPLSVCRLLVDLPVVRARLARRHVGEGAALQWHLDRSGELDAVLEAAGIEDFTVDASHLSIALAAAKVIRAAGWDGPFQTP
jgi:adenylylsulfate kinase